jgi:hypothetical protein
VEITESEVIAAILEAQKPVQPDDPPGAVTTQDLYNSLDIGYNRLRRIIRNLLQIGTLERVIVYRENIGGHPYKTPAWRVVETGD